MKKKFLSLMMVAAVVATTSVSAFAADNVDKTVDIPEGEGKNVNVQITGNVENLRGDVLPGTVSVTVPTAAIFNVNATSGNVTSGEMTITNHSDKKILVFASDFTDTTGNSEIELKKEDQVTQRGQVALKLTGGRKTIFFTSEDKGDKTYGKIYDRSTGEELEATAHIGEVTKDSPLKLRLEGKGGTTGGDNTTPIKDTFQLVFKIKRAN